MALPEIGRLLGVDKILFGSVMREGDRVRVNVTLVDADTEQALWTESFTREFDGLLAMQNEVASAVAREVKLQLTPDEERQLSRTGGPDSATYEAYLRGMFQLHKGSRKGYRRAIEIFTEAVENDPTSALAYAGLAIGYSQLGHSPYPVAGAYPRAKEAAQRAIEFDPDLAEAYLAVAMYKMYYEWDFAGAENAFLRALEINASLVDAHYHYAWLLELLLRDEEAIAFGEYTKKLNPLSPFYTSWLADQYRDARMYEQAIKEAKTTLELNPDYPVAWLTLGQTYLDMGRVEEAVEAHEHLRGNPFWGFALAATLATADRDQHAVEVLGFIEEADNNPFTMALIYGALGDREETMKWLQAGKEQKIPWFPWQVSWYPQTKFLHDDPRMQKFAADLGIALPNPD
jgi:tetratricopeptide (TPR) repeat protein